MTQTVAELRGRRAKKHGLCDRAQAHWQRERTDRMLYKPMSVDELWRIVLRAWLSGYRARVSDAKAEAVADPPPKP